VEHEPEFELVGEPGAKNGEKKLRSGLSHSAEWGSSAQRNRTAEALEAAARAPGCAPSAATDAAVLAAALRSRDSAKLRKRHMLALMREWGYKSDVWRHKHARGHARGAGRTPSWPPSDDAGAASGGGAGGAGGGAGGADALAAHHVAPSHASVPAAGVLSAIGQLGRGVSPASLHAFAASELRPLCASAAAWLRGGELRAAVACAGSPGGVLVLREADMMNHAACADACHGLRADVAHACATLRAWRAELARMNHAEAAQPAWAGLAALHDGCPVEGCLARMRRVLSITAGVLRAMQPSSAAAGAAGSSAAAMASDLDAAAARGLAAAYSCAQEWLARALAALAPSRLAPVSAYLEVAAALGDEAAAFMAEWEAAARDRVTWMGAAMAAAHGASGAAAASAMAAAAAAQQQQQQQGMPGTRHMLQLTQLTQQQQLEQHAEQQPGGAQQDGAAPVGGATMEARQLAQALELAPGLPGMAAAVAAYCAARMQAGAPNGGAPQ
jgi:hypothetical protein